LIFITFIEKLKKIIDIKFTTNKYFLDFFSLFLMFLWFF